MRQTDRIILASIRSRRIRVDTQQGIVYGVLGRPLSPTNHNGYACVTLSHKDKDGRSRAVKVYMHRLIWLAKYGSIPQGKTVTHLEPPDSDNRLDNLAIGRKRGYRVRLLRGGEVRRIRSYKRLSQRQIAQRMGISQARVSTLRRGAA